MIDFIIKSTLRRRHQRFIQFCMTEKETRSKKPLKTMDEWIENDGMYMKEVSEMNGVRQYIAPILDDRLWA